jgi:hypothetical protein
MRIARAAQLVASIILNLLAILIGTAVLSSVLGRGLWHLHTIKALLLVSYSYDAIAAFCLGFLIYRQFKTTTAKWIWILPAAWFLFRVFTLLGGSTSLWSELSGVGCANGLHTSGCVNWFLFTTPFVRSIFYSIGAWLCSRFGTDKASLIEDGFLGKFSRPDWTSAENE